MEFQNFVEYCVECVFFKWNNQPLKQTKTKKQNKKNQQLGPDSI